MFFEHSKYGFWENDNKLVINFYKKFLCTLDALMNFFMN